MVPSRTVVILFSLLVSASHRSPPPPPAVQYDGPLALRRCVLSQAPVARWLLPDRYREVSGLAALGDSAVMVHGDERAIIGVFDPRLVEVTTELRPEENLRGDFEGVARVDEGLVLMNSDGRLFRTERFDSGPLVFDETDTGFGRFCELEGLAWEPEARVLLLPCKTPKDSRLFDALVVFRWSLDENAPAAPAQLMVPPHILRGALGTTLFRATAIERDPVTGHLLVLSSVPGVVVEIDVEGQLLASVSLDSRRHQRAEGITIVGEHVLIADEGLGEDDRGSITAYACSS